MTPIVSTHTTDRFLERVPDVRGDRLAARDMIAVLVSRGVDLGASAVYAAGFTFCLDGPVVVTVYRGRHRHLERQAEHCRRRLRAVRA